MTQIPLPLGDDEDEKDRVYIQPEVLEETLTAAHAAHLDARIDAGLRKMGKALAKALLELGTDLSRMKTSQGYRRLGYTSWEGYLESKHTYGRTYLSYILKLGQAEDLGPYLKLGLSGAQLIEYAKHTDFPSKLPALIDATWQDVREKTIRHMRGILATDVEDHHESFKKPNKRERLLLKGPAHQWQKSFRRQFERLPEIDRDAFLAEMESFINEQRRQSVLASEDVSGM